MLDFLWNRLYFCYFLNLLFFFFLNFLLSLFLFFYFINYINDFLLFFLILNIFFNCLLMFFINFFIRFSFILFFFFLLILIFLKKFFIFHFFFTSQFLFAIYVFFFYFFISINFLKKKIDLDADVLLSFTIFFCFFFYYIYVFFLFLFRIFFFIINLKIIWYLKVFIIIIFFFFFFIILRYFFKKIIFYINIKYNFFIDPVSSIILGVTCFCIGFFFVSRQINIEGPIINDLIIDEPIVNKDKENIIFSSYKTYDQNNVPLNKVNNLLFSKFSEFFVTEDIAKVTKLLLYISHAELTNLEVLERLNLDNNIKLKKRIDWMTINSIDVLVRELNENNLNKDFVITEKLLLEKVNTSNLLLIEENKFQNFCYLLNSQKDTFTLNKFLKSIENHNLCIKKIKNFNESSIIEKNDVFEIFKVDFNNRDDVFTKKEFLFRLEKAKKIVKENEENLKKTLIEFLKVNEYEKLAIYQRAMSEYSAKKLDLKDESFRIFLPSVNEKFKLEELKECFEILEKIYKNYDENIFKKIKLREKMNKNLSEKSIREAFEYLIFDFQYDEKGLVKALKYFEKKSLIKENDLIFIKKEMVKLRASEEIVFLNMKFTANSLKLRDFSQFCIVVDYNSENIKKEKLYSSHIKSLGFEPTINNVTNNFHKEREDLFLSLYNFSFKDVKNDVKRAEILSSLGYEEKIKDNFNEKKKDLFLSLKGYNPEKFESGVLKREKILSELDYKEIINFKTENKNNSSNRL